jgi:probable phosphoglycerate mutase
MSQEPARPDNGLPDRELPDRGRVRGPGRPTTLVLLRHGETPWSPERRFAGSSDIPLTQEGTRQAKAAAERLVTRAASAASGQALRAGAGRWARSAVPGGITTIVASPMLRTRQTAAAVSAATGLPVATDPAWVEIGFGAWEGMTRAEADKQWAAELAAWDADVTVAPPGGESFDAATRRVLSGLDALLAAHSGECVLLVSHLTPIKIVLLHAMLAPPAGLRRVLLSVASLSETDWYPDGTGLVRYVNDTAHI